MTTDSEWIAWGGGACPVEPETEVEVHTTYSFTNYQEKPIWSRAYRCDWNHSPTRPSSDIIAYRIVKP